MHLLQCGCRLSSGFSIEDFKLLYLCERRSLFQFPFLCKSFYAPLRCEGAADIRDCRYVEITPLNIESIPISIKNVENIENNDFYRKAKVAEIEEEQKKVKKST